MFARLRAMRAKMRQNRLEEQMNREQFEAVRRRRFHDLVRHVQANSPYYARIIEERGLDPATCRPEDFPVLTKSLLMANWDDIVTDRRLSRKLVADFLTASRDPADLLLDRYTVIHTSGSSGEVGYFVYGPEDLTRGMGLGRRRQRPKGRRSNRGRFRIAYYGATDGHYAGVTIFRMLQRGWLRLFIKAQLYEVNSPLQEVVAGLNEFKPDAIIGYTTAVKMLAEKQLAGELRLAPVMIGVSGEVTTRADKDLLRQAFACEVTNTYACSEHLGMGTSEPDGDEIILHDNDLIFEFFDDHCLVTNLFNRTLPLIRYRMSDILKPVTEHRHEPYLVIASLVGRNELQPEFLNRDGVRDFISPHTINEVFVSGVTRMQMHLTGEASFNFLVCLDSRLAQSECEQARAGVATRLREILARKGLDNVSFDVKVVDELPVNPVTRKFQLIVDKRGNA